MPPRRRTAAGLLTKAEKEHGAGGVADVDRGRTPPAPDAGRRSRGGVHRPRRSPDGCWCSADRQVPPAARPLPDCPAGRGGGGGMAWLRTRQVWLTGSVRFCTLFGAAGAFVTAAARLGRRHLAHGRPAALLAPLARHRRRRLGDPGRVAVRAGFRRRRNLPADARATRDPGSKSCSLPASSSSASPPTSAGAWFTAPTT